MRKRDFQRQRGDLLEIIRLYGAGEAQWSDVGSALAALNPDGATNFRMVYRKTRIEREWVYTVGMPDDLVRSYMDYFDSINPWKTFWTTHPSGRVGLSSRYLPARSFAETEFYRDWLRHLDRRDEGLGVRVDLDDDLSLIYATHLPEPDRITLEEWMPSMVSGLLPALEQAVHSHITAMHLGERTVSLATLLARNNEAAFVLDRNWRLVSANAPADRMAAMRWHIAVSRGRVTVMLPGAEAFLQGAMNAREAGRPFAEKAFITTGDDQWKLLVTPLPESRYLRLNPFGIPRPLYLVTLRSLGRDADPASATPQAFGLSASETEVCNRLLLGEGPDEIGRHLCLTRETVRTMLKRIFAKTGTTRQAELVALLIRMR